MLLENRKKLYFQRALISPPPSTNTITTAIQYLYLSTFKIKNLPFYKITLIPFFSKLPIILLK